MNLEKLKQALRNIISNVNSILLKAILSVVNFVLRILFSKFVLVFVSAAGSFVVGARLHEVGALDGFFGKDLKNATVLVSGPCSFSESKKVAALAEDEVKITGLFDNKFIGVVRKTREVVECESSKVAVDKLPVLADFRKSPVQIPEIKHQEMDEKIDPEWKKLSQKTLIMSGKCKTESGGEMSPFTDEVVDVTNVEQNKESESAFLLMGIKKSDKIAVTCDSRYIKYSQYMQKSEAKEVIEVKEEKSVKSYLGETILVTGTCFPDTRLPKHKQKQKVVFYPLVNARVQVTEEELNQNTGKLKKFAGAALDAGVMLVCDQSRAALTYKEFDPESMKLSPIKKVGEKREEKDLDSGEDSVPSGVNVSTEEDQNL
jgi:hypothetical protein